MEIKYADNVTLTVEITDQMVKDFKRCQEMAEKVNCDGMDCTAARTTLISWTASVFAMCRKYGKSWKGEQRMTDEKYQEYKKKTEELKPIKSFLFWCGEHGMMGKLISASRILKLGVKFGWAKDEEIVMPKELKERVLETVKKYVEEKEKELEEI